MRTKIWWLSNVIWLILFLSGIVLITIRRVDGAGVIQTPQTKLIALVVLGVFGLFRAFYNQVSQILLAN